MGKQINYWLGYEDFLQIAQAESVRNRLVQLQTEDKQELDTLA